MAKYTQARSFWRIMKSVSLKEIAAEADRTVAVAVVGDGERRRSVMRMLYPDLPDEAAHPLVRSFDSLSEEDGFPLEAGSFDVVIDAGGGWAPTESAVPVYSIVALSGWDRLVERILDERPDLALSMAARFPGLREAVAARIIRETSAANAQFAMLNALPGVVPLLGIVMPTASLGDLILLAKNQAMMLYRLAAAHGLPLDMRARARDVAPMLGNAFGWRAIAREVVGFVPGGVGLAARGVIAYAGTRALGEAMRRYYALGQEPNRAQIARLYRQSIGEAQAYAASLARRIRGIRKPRALLRAKEDSNET